MLLVRKVLIFLVLLAGMLAPAAAQPQHYTWQGVQREYLMFEPAGREGAVPLMFFLHGLGDNITRCAEEMQFDSLATRYGWVIVVPQALKVRGSTMWNAGLGGTADDGGFLMGLLDSLVNVGRVNADSVFCTGFSMGGFMTHRMAIEYGDRITACAPVSGLISYALAEDVPLEPVRVMHIHGTSDEVVGWNGGSAYFGNIGISVDSLTFFWIGWNNCSGTATVDSLPDRMNDGLRFVRHTYRGGDAEFQLLEVIGGRHDWYRDETEHDVDYFDVIHRFFIRDDGR